MLQYGLTQTLSISAMAVDNIGLDVSVIFGDSRSDGSRDIRGTYFVSNERTYEAYHVRPENGVKLSPTSSSDIVGVALALPIDWWAFLLPLF